MWICYCENGMRAGPTILHSSSLIKPLLLPGLIPIKVILEIVLRKILSINILLTQSPTYKWEWKSWRLVSLPVTFLLESPHRVAASTSSLNTSPSCGWHRCLLSGGGGVFTVRTRDRMPCKMLTSEKQFTGNQTAAPSSSTEGQPWTQNGQRYHTVTMSLKTPIWYINTHSLYVWENHKLHGQTLPVVTSSSHSGYCRQYPTPWIRVLQYPTPWRGTPRLLLSLFPPPVPSEEYQKLALMKQEGETLILTGDVGSISLATQILAEPRPQDSTVKAPEQTTAK